MRVIAEQIKAEIERTDEEIIEMAKAHVRRAGAFSFIGGGYIYKRSIDARHKDRIFFVCSVCFEVETLRNINPEILLKNHIKIHEECNIVFNAKRIPANPPVIVGFGPCGMFSALALAKAGFKPVVVEQGENIEDRVLSVEKFYTDKILNMRSNIQFGAGGAGTFSDGKLTTRINDPKCDFILKTFVEFGAPADILTKSKPHIGTDNLRTVVKNIDKEIRRSGGEIRYNTKFLSFENNTATTDKGSIRFSSLILCIGHSSRDTYGYLLKKGFLIEPKPFSVGVRIEHKREDINEAMYGKYANEKRLGTADYNVSYRERGKGVYSFCMCPGGVVVPAASEEGGIVVNGMSFYSRNSENSNSAIAVQVDRDDYGSTPQGAIDFQREIEIKAFAAGGGGYKAPVQTLGDYYIGKAICEPKRVIPSYMNGHYRISDINLLFPPFVNEYLKKGFYEFGKKIKGFDSKDIPVTGVETRTSAPVRIMRNEYFSAVGFENVYPCGEGAGYAGGIMSSAVDGLNVALEIINKEAL